MSLMHIKYTVDVRASQEGNSTVISISMWICSSDDFLLSLESLWRMTAQAQGLEKMLDVVGKGTGMYKGRWKIAEDKLRLI